MSAAGSLSLFLIVASGSGEAAQALQAIPELYPDDFFPAPGALPLNGRVLWAPSQPNATIARITTEGRVELAVDTSTREPFDPAPLLLDVGPLVAGEPLILEANCEGCFEPLIAEWTVEANVDDVPPQYIDEQVITFVGVDGNSPPTWGIHICTPALVNNDVVMHRLHRGDGIQSVQMNEKNGPCSVGNANEVELQASGFFYETLEATDDVTEFCFRLVTVDVAANATFIPEQCIPLVSEEEFSGCAQTSAPTVSMVAVTLCGLLLARLMTRVRCAHSLPRTKT